MKKPAKNCRQCEIVTATLGIALMIIAENAQSRILNGPVHHIYCWFNACIKHQYFYMTNEK